MARAVAAALLLAACAASGHPAQPPVAPDLVDAGPEPDAPPPDLCGGYLVALGPFLGRFEAGLDHLDQAMTAGNRVGAAGAARDLSASLVRERAGLATIKTGDPAIDAVHGDLLLAIDEMASSLAFFAEVIGRQDQAQYGAATGRMARALGAWSEAVARVVEVCPAAR
jgi:hypothetical protein